MTHTYNLLDPRDYLRLFYYLLFNANELPEPKKDEAPKYLILFVQLALLVTVVNIGIALLFMLFRYPFDWQQMGVGIAWSLVIAIVMTGFSFFGDSRNATMLSTVWVGVALASMFGIVLGSVGGASREWLGVATGCVFATAFVSVASFGFVFSIASGVLLAASSLVADVVAHRIDGWAGVLAGSGLLLIGFVFALVGSYVIWAWSQNARLASAWRDWGVILGGLAVASVGVGYLAVWLGHWAGTQTQSPWLVAAVLFLGITRLPLWPAEALWAVVYLRWRAHLPLADQLQWAYFDFATIYPLPGEVTLMRQWAQVDFTAAMDAAIGLATSSGHLLNGVAALHSLAGYNPLVVQIRLPQVTYKDAIDLLQRQVFFGLPIPAASVWQAQLAIKELTGQLRVSNQGPVESPPQSISRSLHSTLLQNDAGRPARVPPRDLLQRIGQQIDVLAAAKELDPQLRYVGDLVACYRSILAAATAEGIAAIAAFTQPNLPENVLDLFPPRLQAALADLDQAAGAVRDYQAATAPISRRNLLLRVNQHIESVAQWVVTDITSFDPLLTFTVARWREILAAEGGRLAGADVNGPVPNPYVLSNPARGALFVGREDILHRLEELWGAASQAPSVVLFGHRRMGKTSILQNLGTRFDTKTVIVYFSMQGVGRVKSTGELLFNLALKLYDVIPLAIQAALSEPTESAFLEHNPYLAFDRYLARVGLVRGDYRFIITVDEFEGIEEQIREGRLEPALLQHWRTSFQTYPWLIMAFAGLHTLEEMQQDYWNPLYASVTAIPVSYLSPAATRRLITHPSDDFAIDYDADAIERIIELTHGQPYLVQLTCHALVARFNRLTFEEGKEQPRRFTLDDVEMVIKAPEFYRDGNAYFGGVWKQATESLPTGQTAVLQALCHGPRSVNELRVPGLSLAEAQAAVEVLCRHDVIVQQGDEYTYAVELMRRWVEQKKGG